MKKYFTVKKPILILLTVAVLIGIGAVSGIIAAGNKSFGEINIEKRYGLNTVLDVPEVMFKSGTEEHSTTPVLYYPSGKTLSGYKHTLDEVGEYTLEYRLILNSTLHKTSKTFKVNRDLFSVTGVKSKASYGKNKYLGELLGINVSLVSGDKFHYNKIIDLADSTKTDNLINMFFTPEKLGVTEVNRLIITLTDIYDSSNFVTITSKTKIGYPDTMQAVVNASNGQVPTGLERYTGTATNIPVINYTGRNYRLHVGSQWGTGIGARASFSGQPRYGDITTNYLAYRYDYSDKMLYAHVDEIADMPVADLDNPLMFTELWQGFRTGEVRLSIEAADYERETVNFMITEVYGDDLVNHEYFEDSEAPIISVDFDGYQQDSLPNGVINEPYKIFGAKAYDLMDGAVSVTAQVYYKYNSNNKVNVFVDEGKFVPTREGIYTIKYTAKDVSGNEDYRIVEVDVLPMRSAELSLTLGSIPQTNGYVGTSITVAGSTIQNHIGIATLSVEASLRADASISYVIDSQDNSFVPMYIGDYTVRYVYGDYLASKSFSYDITVSASDVPLIVDAPKLPDYFIKGLEYQIPSLSGYKFTANGPEAIDTKVYIVNDSGAEDIEVLQGRSVITANNQIALKYVASNNGEVFSRTFTRTVIDTGYGTAALDMSKYFFGTQFVSSADSSGIQYETNATAAPDKTAKLSFINSLIPYRFGVAFNTVEGKDNFSAVDIIVYSEGDVSKSVKITYSIFADKTIITINDSEQSYTVLKGFGLSKSDFLQFGYNDEAKSFNAFTGVTIPIKTYLSKEAFDGFGECLQFEITMRGITGSAAIKIISVANQNFTNSTEDRTSPVMTQYQASSDKVLGSNYTILPAYAADVLNPNISFVLTVTDSAGKHVTATDGTLLFNSDPTRAYTIALSRYGNYRVQYSASDGISVAAPYRFNINVIDDVAPIISLDGVKNTAKIGDTVSIATATISDNETQEISVLIYILRPNNKLERLQTQSFKAETEGTYKIFYYGIDNFGNVTVESYVITVSK